MEETTTTVEQRGEAKRQAHEVLLESIEKRVRLLRTRNMEELKQHYAALASLTQVLSDIVIPNDSMNSIGTRVLPILKEIVELHAERLETMPKAGEEGEPIRVASPWIQKEHRNGAPAPVPAPPKGLDAELRIA